MQKFQNMQNIIINQYYNDHSSIVSVLHADTEVNALMKWAVTFVFVKKAMLV